MRNDVLSEGSVRTRPGARSETREQFVDHPRYRYGDPAAKTGGKAKVACVRCVDASVNRIIFERQLEPTEVNKQGIREEGETQPTQSYLLLTHGISHVY